jgi:hypothetical protein
MGAVDLPRESFIELVEKNAHQSTREGHWELDDVDASSWVRQR